MTDLEPRREQGLDRRPVARPQVDLHKDRGLDLTPQEVAQRRSNRRWMLTLAAVAIVIFAAVLIADALYSAGEPPGPNISVPPGYHKIDDSYYAYAVPNGWANNPDGTDQAGDVETSGPSGWVAENISYYKNIPTLYEVDQPASLQAFGQKAPAPYTLSGGHPITVTGASGAFEYTMTRTDGFTAVVVDSWYAGQDVELWLEIDAPSNVASTILSTLTAGEAR
jgi:hypothetical protein